MTCDRVQAELPLYAEGDLDDTATHAIDAHLAQCGDCQRALEGISESQRALKALRSVYVDADAMQAMRARVLERLASVQVEAARRARLFRRVAAGALAAAALVVTSSVTTLWITTPRNSAPLVNETRNDGTPPAATVDPGPILIKWVTNNPKVEVYLISKAQVGETRIG